MNVNVWFVNERIIIFVVPLLVARLLVVPTELTEDTEAYGLKLLESTEWPTLREARIHRNDCLRSSIIRRLRRRKQIPQARRVGLAAQPNS